MKDKQKPMTPEENPCNRGVTGQDLCDSTNQPGNPHTGRWVTTDTVNMDPRSRDDEGA
mgnify:CR=1 FL=1